MLVKECPALERESWENEAEGKSVGHIKYQKCIHVIVNNYFPLHPYVCLGYILTGKKSNLEKLKQYWFVTLIILNVIKIPFEKTNFLRDKMNKTQG